MYFDLTIDPRTQDADWSMIQTRSAMAVPLVRENRLKAILYLNHRDVREWTTAEIALVQDVAARTWDALERAYAEESLRELAASLSDANHRKTEFLATLAHELRNPLAPIRTGLELMRIGEDKPETVKRVRMMMERQIGSMVHLIDDLLDIARISSGKIELKREIVALRQIVTAAVETSMPVIESNRHDLGVDLPTEDLLLNVDRVRLAQVVSNLLTNAAKYTPRNGKLNLVGVRENDEVVISVSDNGIGIARESLTGVFEMFSQVKSTIERSQGGLGIGLSLVHRLVEMHEGTVIATSPGIGQGSTFVVRLPLANTNELPPLMSGQTQPPTGESPARLEILVADDNQDAADMLARLLQSAGHEVRLANDGYHTVRSALTNRPDIAIIDIGMPGLNGHEVAKALRRIPEMQKTVLVALTGWGSAEDLMAAKNAGFDHHLTKPVQIEKIEAIVNSLQR
ncbi:MAG: response regulator [Bdellovibrionales bacterium]|nr:response regulator [Massilia sp.]